MKEYLVKVDDKIEKIFELLSDASLFSKSLKNVYEANRETKKITIERRITKTVKEIMTNNKSIVKASEIME